MAHNILLLQADPVVLESVARVLLSEGYSVYPLQTVEGALGVLGTASIEVAIVDVDLPEKNGWAACGELKARAPQVPVILITAQPNMVGKAANCGAAALMEKPLDFPELLCKVQSLLSSQESVFWKQRDENSVEDNSYNPLVR